jgi:hypothetical protein
VTALQVLFIGGTGVISAAAARRAVETGIDLTVMTRGHPDVAFSARRCEQADRRHQRPASDPGRPGGRVFDAVVDWVAFTPDQIQRDIELFAGRTQQFVFISSASAYQTPLP